MQWYTGSIDELYQLEQPPTPLRTLPKFISLVLGSNGLINMRCGGWWKREKGSQPAGFEPASAMHNGFPDRPLRPLGHDCSDVDGFKLAYMLSV
jgi:hypothetical protein